jgi:hypothetical protein
MPRTWSKTIALFLLVFFASSCGGHGFDQRLQLARNKNLWQSQNLHNYSFHSTLSCFCLNGDGKEVLVTVRADTVQSISVISTGAKWPNDYWPTIDTEFSRLESLITGGDMVVVKYDPQMGYPIFIDISCGPNIADCGARMTMSQLQKLS